MSIALLIISNLLFLLAASLMAQVVKNLPVMQETQVRSLCWEESLEKRIATHSSILAWRILWTDLLQNGLVGSPCSPRDSQESSPTPQFKSINSSALSLLHSPTLTSIHDHGKNHSLD